MADGRWLVAQVGWMGVAFLLGALPFSLWIGRLVLGVDIRHYGDANPGATNVLRAGGRMAAGAALLLDMLKGAVPVGVAHLLWGWSGWELVAVALAPVLGHAFSPLLRFRGGKAVATTGGIWTGLTVWEGPLVGGLLLGIFVVFLGANGRAVLATMLGLLLYFVLTPPAWNLLDVRPPLLPALLSIWAGNFLLLAWKHRFDLIGETVRGA